MLIIEFLDLFYLLDYVRMSSYYVYLKILDIITFLYSFCNNILSLSSQEL